MNADYLMYIASFLYLMCYIPELYANYVNKNANIYNLPEKVIMLLATGCGFSYAILNDNIALIVNYGPMLILDITALGMRVYYAYFYVSGEQCHIEIIPSPSSEQEIE
jgi:uncharacterized protein with PQ loop repeat